MDKKIIRLLKADEIECRIGNISEKGVSILLYKDARVDQKILDEVFGPFGWKRSHASIDGNLYCTVSVSLFVLIARVFSADSPCRYIAAG